MTDSLFARASERRPKPNGGDDASQNEEIEDLGTFGYLRGTRERTPMLELRKKTGNIQAFSYALLDRAEFDASEGIVVHVAGRTIRIKGRNLNHGASNSAKLFQGIVRHRVAWIQEADQATRMQIDGNRVLVDSIEW